ncbi:MAG: c-type cytochrome, partial [Bryobacterales bacterium]|nr:c-type cytochrome [Bryobacterales bacterium]
MASSYQPALAHLADDVRGERQAVRRGGRGIGGPGIRVAMIAAALPFFAAAADFVRDVQPVFQKKCSGCHGASMQSSGLRLDNRDAALKGGYSGPVIVPGQSAGSRLYRLVAGLDSKLRMPPAGPALSPGEVAALKEWIDEGAVWPDVSGPATVTKSAHWAFLPIQRPTPPPTRNAAWVRNPIDAFVLARLEQRGVPPSAEADAT